ncbi:MAG TPA: FAD-dependent monooxygenase [Actinocatenispora sp.]
MSDPVLIVGAGPVGLTTALALHRYDVPAVVVEKHPGTSVQPKARRFTFRTMEVFRSLGVADAVYAAAEGLAAHQAMRTGRTLADSEPLPPPPHVDYGSLAAISPEQSCLVAQDLLEPVLLREVRARGIPVHFRTALTDLAQDDTGVTARIGEPLRAAYVVGADGAHSTVRDLLGVPVAGRGTLGDAVNVYFEADLDAVTAGREFNLCQVTEPVPGAFASVDGRYRWLFLTTEPPAGADWADVVRQAIGVPGTDVTVLSALAWQPAMRVAERFRVGRVFLAGDAAHVMPPYAALGANTGIQDAADLAWKIASVRAGTAGPGLLETYHEERHAAGWHTAEQSVLRGTPGATGLDHPFALVAGYQYATGALVDDGADPQPTDRLELTGRPGTRLPHLRVGGLSTLDLVGTRPTLLPGPAADDWRRAADKLDIPVADAGPGWPAAAGIDPDGALLVRPDHVVAWRSRGTGDVAALAAARDTVLRRD